MIVGVCGFGSTGSGAVMDFLREFDEVSVGEDMELSFLYDPDGVLDMENKLISNPIRFYSGDAAIKRYRKLMNSYDLKRYVKRYMPFAEFRKMTEEYIAELIVMQWDGALWHFDRRQVGKIGYFFKYWLGGKYLRVFDKLHKDQPERFWNHKMYIPVHDERFYTATRKYTKRLLDSICGGAKKIIAIDQPFPSNNPQCCFKFFEQQCKAVIVNRDPRDLYLLSKKNAVGWEMRFTPIYNVEDFIIYYKDQMELIKRDSKDVLYIQFEDLVYDYENAAKKIKQFLDLKNHAVPQRYFNPSISIANTQMALRYPEYNEDIKKIEQALPEYLYPFDESKADLNAKTWCFKTE